MSIKLYEISQSYLNILDLLEDEEENKELFQHALGMIDDAFETKAENIAKVLNAIKGNIEIVKAEEKRLYDRRKAMENKMGWLKKYLEDEMIAIDKKKFKTDLFSFGIQKNPPSLKVTTEEYIPEEYYEVTRSLIRRELLKDIKEGLVIDGVSLTQSESLRIR